MARPCTRPTAAAFRGGQAAAEQDRSATPTGASGQRSYGGSARATSAPRRRRRPAAAEASRSPPRRRGRSAGGCRRGLTGRGGRHDGLLPGTSRTDRHAIVPGLRRYNVSARRAVPTGVLPGRRVRARTALRTDLVRPAAGSKAVVYWAVGPFPCLTPVRSLPHPGRRRRSDLAPGRRLRIAPSPARSRQLSRRGIPRGCPVVDVVTLVARPVAVNSPLTCADAQKCRWGT